MALKITLVAATGMILLEKTGILPIRRPSQGLFYDLMNSTLLIYQMEDNQLLSSEINTDIQDSAGATLANDTAIKTYLDAIIGVQKTV